MAFFAELNSDNVVIRVVVIDDAEAPTEEAGIAWCNSFFGTDTWKQTWADGSRRINYADVGGKYDPIKDAFIPIQPYPSWILDSDNKFWNPPIPCPDDGHYYNWDEANKSWVLVKDATA